MFIVTTESGLPVYENASKEACKAYIEQALAKGSKPGFLKIEETPDIYTAEQWQKDRTFNAAPGQEITADIYEEMLNCMPPERLPRDKISGYTCGFLMGEPHSTEPGTGKELYLAFGKRENGRYYYIGLLPTR